MPRISARVRSLLPLFFAAVTAAAFADLPDIASVPPDLTLPPVSGADAAASAGLRVPMSAPGWESTAVRHLLYLPTDWQPSGRFPVVVEWTGNQYKSPSGDTCSGLPENAKLGFGITAGAGALWLTLPYLDKAGTQSVTRWWGDAPAYDPEPTLAYCRAAVRAVCARFGGDSQKVVLVGFSRGSIATNYLGLHDEETARLWRGFVCYSHYDGVQRWPFPDSDSVSAATRLQRLAGRPQFICGEGSNADQTRAFLEKNGLLGLGVFTFCSTGFRNHDDAWILRPSEARTQLRDWFHQLVQ